MKQSEFLRIKELFHRSDIVRKYSFKTVSTRDSYAILARANHYLAMIFAISRGESALFQKKDCFECLSPYIKDFDGAKNAPSTRIAV
jgi:hypothetical protein